MRSGRNGDHHAQALKIGGTALALGAALLTAYGPARAETRKISADGTVHEIVTETWTNHPEKWIGTALRHYRQDSDGATESALVTGTDDLAMDRDPSIDIDPAYGRPVMAWSRDEGRGYDVFVSRFDGSAWMSPRLIEPLPGDDSRPEAKVTGALVHVVWGQDNAGERSMLRASVDHDTLECVFGPETLPLSEKGIVLPEGQSSEGSPPAEPPRTDAFFAAECPSKVPGGPGRIHVWGVRDAPVPVDYHQAFALPGDLHNVQHPTARWIADRFVLSYNTVDRFYYSMWSDAGWSDLRTVVLGSNTSASDAQVQMEEMVRRLSGR